MSQAISEEIEHLDFEPEPEYIHHRHPTIPDVQWCGKPRTDNIGWMCANGGPSQHDQTCPECLRLIKAFGISWYWETHRKHFGSNCTARNNCVYHDCGV